MRITGDNNKKEQKKKSTIKESIVQICTNPK